MKILIVPMVAVAQTDGPSGRAEQLAAAFAARGFEVALCHARGTPARAMAGVQAIPVTVPSPMGLPTWLGKRIFPLAEKLGVIGRKPVRSFEQVLHLAGISAQPCLAASVAELQGVIRVFEPDAVYSEFSLPAIIAALAEHTPLFASHSYPAQAEYAASPQYAKPVNRVLKSLGLPPVRSALELFERATLRVVPSSPALEPMAGENLLFTGPFAAAPAAAPTEERDCVLVYMGYGTIPRKRMLRAVKGAFSGSRYTVYVAGRGLGEYRLGNLCIAPRFPFAALLPRAAVLISHGGQNSVMDGLRYGVPQLLCPGLVFERLYNAKSVMVNGAGLLRPLRRFTPSIIQKTVDTLTADPRYAQNALRLGRELTALGGANAVVDAVAERLNAKP